VTPKKAARVCPAHISNIIDAFEHPTKAQQPHQITRANLASLKMPPKADAAPATTTSSEDPAVLDGSVWAKVLGPKLVRRVGTDPLETVDTAQALRGKHVGLYFSAHWCVPAARRVWWCFWSCSWASSAQPVSCAMLHAACAGPSASAPPPTPTLQNEHDDRCPPCRKFTPRLADTYSILQKKENVDWEVVFVSFDKSQPQFEVRAACARARIACGWGGAPGLVVHICSSRQQAAA